MLYTRPYIRNHYIRNHFTWKLACLTMFIFITLIFIPLALSAQKDSGQSEALKKVAELSLKIGDKALSEKDVVEGFKATVKDELDSWMWKSIGGYERLITGDLDIEGIDSYINQAKKKLEQGMQLLDTIGKVATALGEGKYDDAVIATIDNAVSLVDNPVVTITWTAIKLTYESHKAVVDTGVALQLEALYGKIDNDRMLFGTQDQSGPKQIPRDSKTADYFFNKYIITDTGVRDLVKTYVKVKIGDEWPEQSWGQWVIAWALPGSSQDEETLRLATEFRNKARSWIMMLFDDVNKQAKLRWAQMRVQQQQAAFDQFKARYGSFYKDLPSLIEKFKQVSRYKKEIPKYSQMLTDSKKERQATEATFNTLKPADITTADSLIKKCKKWKDDLRQISAQAFWVQGAETLAEQLEQEMYAWVKLWDKIDTHFKKEEKELVKNIGDQISQARILYGDDASTQSEARKRAQEYYNKRYAPLLKVFNFDAYGSPDKAKELFLSYLNRGEFGVSYVSGQRKPYAEYMLRAWEAQDYQTAFQKNNLSEPKNTGMMSKHYQQVSQQLENEIKKVRDELKTYEESIKKELDAIDRDSRYTSYDQREKAKQPLRRNLEIARGSVDYSEKLSRDALKNLMTLSQNLHSDTYEWMKTALNSFNSLRQARSKQYSEFTEKVESIARKLPVRPASAGTNWQPEVFRSLQSAQDELSQNMWVSIGKKIPEDTNNPFRFPEAIDYMIFSQFNKSSGSLGAGYQPKGDITWLGNLIESNAKTWTEGVQALKSLAVPNSEEIKQIQVLINSDFSLDILKPLQDAANKVPSMISDLRDKYRTLLRDWETNELNKQTDANWLMSMAKQWREYFKLQVSRGYLTDNRGNYLIPFNTLGYSKVDKPYPHNMTKSERDKMVNQMKNEWNNLEVSRFVKNYAPLADKAVGQLFGVLEKLQVVDEDNFLIKDAMVTAGAIEKAKQTIRTVDVKASDYMTKMQTIMDTLPGILRQGAGDVEIHIPIDYELISLEIPESNLNFPLGKSYLETRNLVKGIIDKRIAYRKELKEQLAKKGTSGPGMAMPAGMGSGGTGTGGPPAGPGQASRPGQPTGVVAGVPPAGVAPMTVQGGPGAGVQSPGGQSMTPPQGQGTTSQPAGQPGIMPPQGAQAQTGQPPQGPMTPPSGMGPMTTPQTPAGQPGVPLSSPPTGKGSVAQAGTPPVAQAPSFGGQAPAMAQAGVPAITSSAGQGPTMAQPLTQPVPQAAPQQGTMQVASLPTQTKIPPAGAMPSQASAPPQSAVLQSPGTSKPQTPQTVPAATPPSGLPQPSSQPSGLGVPPQTPPAQPPKAASAPSISPQLPTTQPPKTGTTGSMPQQPGMGTMASLQPAGSAQKSVDMTPKVKDLYNQFKQAYESKNVSGVIRCLSSQWTSVDGGSISDLQRHLSKIFNLYDEVRFTIQNLKINKIAEGKFTVSYDVTIASRIYKKNLKHEEKSSINEEVIIDESGNAKISKTLGGKLLSIK